MFMSCVTRVRSYALHQVIGWTAGTSPPAPCTAHALSAGGTCRVSWGVVSVVGPWYPGVLVSWCPGVVVLWCRGGGVVVLWRCDVVLLWCRGVVVPWCRGIVMPRFRGVVVLL